MSDVWKERAATMLKFKMTTVGSSVGFIVPKEAQIRLGVTKGDVVYLTPAPGGGYRLTAHDPEFARDMELVREIMREDRDLLQELAR
jgi:putative addiction module antidote